jgi:citrate lyase subunit beta/citryl-CoA lyase
MTPRSWLFVPGDSPRKMEKGLTSGADALILDLEDSVASSQKLAARAQVAAFIEANAAGPVSLWVRVNPFETGLTEGDIAEVIPAGPAGIVLPKPDSARQLEALEVLLAHAEQDAGAMVGRTSVLPIATETPLSIFNMHTYVGASARLAGLTWGAEDLSTAVGAATARTADGAYTPLYDLARSLCLAGAAAAGVAAIETVYPDFRDLDGMAAYAARGRRDGFAGAMIIHPSQVAVTNAAFTPSPAELDHARKVIALFEANPSAGALALDGMMLDAPHLRQAQRILAAAVRP